MWRIWWMNNKKRIAEAGLVAAIGTFLAIGIIRYGSPHYYWFEDMYGDVGIAEKCKGSDDGLYCWKKYGGTKIKVKRYWRNP